LLEQSDRITIPVRQVMQRGLLERGGERDGYCVVREAKVGRRLTDGLRVRNLFSVESVRMAIDGNRAGQSRRSSVPKDDEGR
jgi:hypothetical protein